MPVLNDLEGNKFGRLSVGCRTKKSGKYYYLCVCECGTEKLIAGPALTRASKPTRSCGCIRDTPSGEANPNYKHGGAIGGKRSRSLKIWAGMLDRCTNPKNKAYPRYGARGIHVCDRWKDYSAFIEDMGPPPPGASIERVDNAKGYDPDNCRWATQSEQTRNTSRNRMVTLDGETMCLFDACQKCGVNYWTVRSRLKRGLSLEDSLGLKGEARQR